jgi:hypothetical protein
LYQCTTLAKRSRTVSAAHYAGFSPCRTPSHENRRGKGKSGESNKENVFGFHVAAPAVRAALQPSAERKGSVSRFLARTSKKKHSRGRLHPNAYLADLYELVSFLGYLNQQTSELPPGTKVRLVVRACFPSRAHRRIPLRKHQTAKDKPSVYKPGSPLFRRIFMYASRSRVQLKSCENSSTDKFSDFRNR